MPYYKQKSAPFFELLRGDGAHPARRSHLHNRLMPRHISRRPRMLQHLLRAWDHQHREILITAPPPFQNLLWILGILNNSVAHWHGTARP